jgi:hypothetical protein
MLYPAAIALEEGWLTTDGHTTVRWNVSNRKTGSVYAVEEGRQAVSNTRCWICVYRSVQFEHGSK